MRYLQERGRFRRRLQSPILAIALFIIFILVARSTWEVYKKDRIARINREESEKALSLLRARKEYLNSQLKNLSTERGVEGELRSKYQVTKEGEKGLVIVEDISTTSRKEQFLRD